MGLCTLLWNWEICDAFRKGQEPCQEPDCPWKRSSKLERFFNFYKEVTSSYVPELLAGSPAALRSHDDLLDLIKTIRSQPTRTRTELTAAYFTGRKNVMTAPLPADQHRAVNLAVQVMSMISCTASKHAFGGVLELGSLPILWQDRVGFADFISSAFPVSEPRRIQPEVRFAIVAARLKKIASLRFEPTDDLRNHLRLDSQNGAVQSSRTSAMLAQISREVLHSIQTVLFPFNSDSEILLRGLVRKESLDPDCTQYGFTVGGDDFAYSFFGSKLMDLYEEVNNPSPRGFMEKWFERRSGARYVMMATLIGVIIAIVLGILSLAIGIFQSWVAYQAWKYPVSTGN
ncbi:hypothetical protein PG993_005189 [Apiospora rasikravindrae]|uniref:Uncharacterized protein n=1 Tax=Apiospora rasikravindrae TaxID=990691 RepID=A0ABR1TEW4_9PEZI